MNSDWDDLRFFLALARHPSLRRAADALGVNHGTVLQRLKRLEERLGTRLFERTRNGLVATMAGEDLRAHAEHMEESFRALSAEIGGRDTALEGTIRVGAPFALMQAGLSDLFATFMERYPGINLDLEIADRFSSLARLEADITVRMAFSVDDDAVGQRVLQYHKSAYARPETIRLLRAKDPRVAWLDWKEAGADGPWTGNTGYPEIPLRHNFPDHRAQIEMARRGPYLTLLPCFLGDASDGLVRVPGAAMIADRSIWLLYRQGLRETARIRALRDALLAHFRERRHFYVGAAGATE